MLETLKIDEEFRTIIPPLTQDEYTNLEHSLICEGCHDAIRAWNNVIVDGHNRYEICQKWKIPYRVIHMFFPSRESAIAWICLNQLSRRNLTREAYKYLIGKRYDAEKADYSQRNLAGINQYSPKGSRPTDAQNQTAAKRTSKRLAREYNLSHATIERYGEYSRVLDRIETKKPGVLPSLLSGRYRVSQQELTDLSKLPKETVASIMEKAQSTESSEEATPTNNLSTMIAAEKKEPQRTKAPQLDTKIKDLPEYDPDAEINGLTFTIPTWIDTISRLSGIPIRYASEKAKFNITKALNDLVQAISTLQHELEDRT